MTGITRSAAARIIAGHFHSSAVHVGGTYDTYTVEDNTGRKWKVVSDASIKCQSRGERTASRLYAVEMVTPICKYEDIETIQQLVRELRRGGARVNDSCGIHIHVDASRHDPKTLRNIVNIMASKEDLLYKALNVQIDRECYCQKADLRFLEDVNLKHPKSMAEFETLWYNGDSRRNVHYDYSRYHALNLHSVFSKGTVEFRMFNSTLHAGEVKSYIQLCLAISHQALVQQRAMRARTHSENEKYTFRTWLLRLGLIGDEFKTARQHLLKNLEGRGDLVSPELRRLAVHDREKGTQYCETLYHYLTCCHSLKKTSDALYTHRNTVLYRIRRLQEDFAIPLEEPSQHADLLLGVSLILFEIKGPDFFLRAPKNEA